VAYIPIVRREKEASADERARRRRNSILQRVLFLAFGSAIEASHDGVEFFFKGRCYKAFPRILLYICDLPEEKAVLCLKSGNCSHPCSLCDVKRDDAGSVAALTSEDRDALETLKGQMESNGHRLYARESARRTAVEANYSVHSAVPALAAMGGLSSAPYLMYKMVGVDILHVRFPPLVGIVRCSLLLTYVSS